MIIPFCLFLSTHSSKNREIDTIMSRKVIEFDRCKEVELSFINTSVSRGTYRLFSSRSSHQCPFYLWCWRCLSPKIDLLALIHCLRYLLSRYHSGLLLDHLYIVDYPTQYSYDAITFWLAGSCSFRISKWKWHFRFLKTISMPQWEGWKRWNESSGLESIELKVLEQPQD